MAHFPVDALGVPLDDRVRIALGGTDVRIFEQYEVKHSFFTSPSAFACRIGSGDFMRELTALYPPNTPYELRVAEIVQHTGRLDGYGPEDSSGATAVSLRGRDGLAPLHDAYILADRSFSNASFVELTSLVLQAVGIDEFTLSGDNAANRAAVSGTRSFSRLVDNPSQATREALARLEKQQASAVAANPTAFYVPITPGQVPTLVRQGVTVTSAPTKPTVEIVTIGAPPGAQAKPLQAKAGGRWWELLHKEYRRGGLFLQAAGDPLTFILGQPNTTQAPLYGLYRQRGAPANAVNVLRARHQNETTRRYARYIVRGRAGGSTKKAGRSQIGAEVVDEEMTALGYTKAWAHVDAEAKNAKRAEFLARRKMAEDRRAGWSLGYTVLGHTAPILGGSGLEERAIWTVDTMVQVRDDEYGINGDFWIESVTLRGSNSGTTTELVLHRPEDLVFGEPDYA